VAQSPEPLGDGYDTLFGTRGDVFLVRPDGHVALTAAARTAPQALRAWCAKWLNKTILNRAGFCRRLQLLI